MSPSCDVYLCLLEMDLFLAEIGQTIRTNISGGVKQYIPLNLRGIDWEQEQPVFMTSW